MANKPPPWVVSNEESVRREVERYRGMTTSERGAILYAVCEAAGMLSADPERFERARLWRDPLPESTVRALTRLRAEYRKKHPDGRRRPKPC
jgi:hypothetical protein